MEPVRHHVTVEVDSIGPCMVTSVVQLKDLGESPAEAPINTSCSSLGRFSHCEMMSSTTACTVGQDPQIKIIYIFFFLPKNCTKNPKRRKLDELMTW